ncbi:MAG: hypothetical protein K2N06_10490 [Oscillospiraceae bacterium]|nr:hypothetical protein [Oscillospiraceae bacterium]
MGLFGKKKTLDTSNVRPVEISERSKGITIDIHNDCFMINSIEFDIPTHIDAFKAVFGEPRVTEFETTGAMREYLEESSGKPVTNRTNYTWDELGMECYTYDGKTVNSFCMYLNASEYESDAAHHMMFGGKLTINEQHWLPVIKRGKEACGGTSQKAIVGKYSVIAGLIDYNQRISKTNETSFESINIAALDDFVPSSSKTDALALEMLQRSLDEKANAQK